MALNFFSLDPDPETTGFIQMCKGRVADQVGTQRYLADGPHLTLYVGAFQPGPPLFDAVAARVPTASLVVPLAGWHTFHHDPVTGGHTLVLKVADEGMTVLRELQLAVVGAALPHREPGIPDRYRDTTGYSPAMIDSVNRYGFPFVGDIWQAHLTIASFTHGAYEQMKDDLLCLAPPSEVRFPRLSLNAVAENGFRTLATWEIPGA